MNDYLRDEEYEKWFFNLDGARDEVVNLLKARGLGRGSEVLDIAAGHGTLTLKAAEAIQDGSVTAVGLVNDLRDYKWYRTQVPEGQFSDIVYYLEMDATNLKFEDGSFDFVINFLGLEDIRMTRGDEGVVLALEEMARVTRPGGYVQIAVSVYGDEPDEGLLENVESFIGHGAIFPPPELLVEQLTKIGLEVEDERLIVPGRKLTAEQAKREIRFACEKTPEVFDEYGVKTRSFAEVWERFGHEIERVGLAHYSRIVCIIARKPVE